MVERSLRPEPLADVSTACHIHLALTRRGIAAELAGVLSFIAHEDLRNTLMNALIDVPPGRRYQRLSLEHVREVDFRVVSAVNGSKSGDSCWWRFRRATIGRANG